MSRHSGNAEAAEAAEATPIFEEILSRTGISWPAEASTKDTAGSGGVSG